jgi:outer membrane lipoprotein SlyB
MEAKQVTATPITITPTHPLLLLAAASVTLLSLAGVGTLAGWLPGPAAHNASPPEVAAKLTTMPAAAPIPPRQNIAVPQKAPGPVAESAKHAPAGIHRDAPAPVATNPAIAAAPAYDNVAPTPGYSAVSPAPTFSTAPPEATYRVAAAQPSICNECGVVETVREVAVEPKGGIGGAIAGGLVGGLIANQIGKGSGRSIATVLGAAGGAYAGNYIEKSVRQTKRYEVVVRFEDDSRRTFGSETPPAWQSGDRVRLQNGLLTMGGGRPNGNPGTI